jgi:hypothetical protein
MAKPTSPSPPHYSPEFGRHVDIAGPNGKIHKAVQNELGAAAIAAYQRSAARAAKGR